MRVRCWFWQWNMVRARMRRALLDLYLRRLLVRDSRVSQAWSAVGLWLEAVRCHRRLCPVSNDICSHVTCAISLPWTHGV